MIFAGLPRIRARVSQWLGPQLRRTQLLWLELRRFARRQTRAMRNRWHLGVALARRLRRKLLFSSALFLFQTSQRMAALWAEGKAWALRWFTSLTSVGLAAAFVSQEPQQGFGTAGDVHLACATLIGTALVLVLTLSIIPAQRAAEAFSSAILRLSARDRYLHFAVGCLGVLTLVSLLFGMACKFGLSDRYALALQILLVGATVDLVRRFYRRTLDLLEPSTALRLVLDECTHYISTRETKINRLARIYALRAETRTEPVVNEFARIFHAAPGATNPLRFWNDQLEEFAHKAIARGDTQAAVEAVDIMAIIGKRYATARRGSVGLAYDFSVVVAVPVSDVGNALGPIYESFARICETGIAERSEATVRAVLSALGQMAILATTVVHGDPMRGTTAPLVHAPVYFLGQCAQKAGKAGMEDALLTAAARMGGLLDTVQADVDFEAGITEAIECLADIAEASYGRHPSAGCFPALKAMLTGAKKILQVKGYDTPSPVDGILDRIRALVPFEVMAEKAGRRRLQIFPPYDPSFEASIPMLLAVLAERSLPDPERDWVDPFHDFIEASEEFVAHYRQIADNVTFGRTLLRKWIVTSVMQAAHVHRRLLADPPSGADACR